MILASNDFLGVGKKTVNNRITYFFTLGKIADMEFGLYDQIKKTKLFNSLFEI